MALCTADELEVPVNTVRGAVFSGEHSFDWVLQRVSLTWGSVPPPSLPSCNPFSYSHPFSWAGLSFAKPTRQLCLRQESHSSEQNCWHRAGRCCGKSLTSLNYCNRELDVQKKINASHLSASRANVILFLLPLFICLCLDSSEVKCNTAGELALVTQSIALLNSSQCSSREVLLVDVSLWER